MLAAACDKESALLHKQQSLLAKNLQAAQEELFQLKGGRQAQNTPVSPTQSEEVAHFCHMQRLGRKRSRNAAFVCHKETFEFTMGQAAAEEMKAFPEACFFLKQLVKASGAQGSRALWQYARLPQNG